jgi:hypothetical protein
MCFHTFGENTLVNTVASGTFINATSAGTLTPVFTGNHQYHALVFAGTIANTGTLFAYAATNAAGSNMYVLGSAVFGSSNFGAAIFEVKTDVIGGLGTVNNGTSDNGTYYTHFTGQVKVDSGGTATGALIVVSSQPRTAPSGSWATYGSLYA